MQPRTYSKRRRLDDDEEHKVSPPGAPAVAAVTAADVAKDSPYPSKSTCDSIVARWEHRFAQWKRDDGSNDPEWGVGTKRFLPVTVCAVVLSFLSRGTVCHTLAQVSRGMAWLSRAASAADAVRDTYAGVVALMGENTDVTRRIAYYGGSERGRTTVRTVAIMWEFSETDDEEQKRHKHCCVCVISVEGKRTRNPADVEAFKIDRGDGQTPTLPFCGTCRAEMHMLCAAVPAYRLDGGPVELAELLRTTFFPEEKEDDLSHKIPDDLIATPRLTPDQQQDAVHDIVAYLGVQLQSLQLMPILSPRLFRSDRVYSWPRLKPLLAACKNLTTLNLASPTSIYMDQATTALLFNPDLATAMPRLTALATAAMFPTPRQLESCADAIARLSKWALAVSVEFDIKRVLKLASKKLTTLDVRLCQPRRTMTNMVVNQRIFGPRPRTLSTDQRPRRRYDRYNEENRETLMETALFDVIEFLPAKQLTHICVTIETSIPTAMDEHYLLRTGCALPAFWILHTLAARVGPQLRQLHLRAPIITRVHVTDRAMEELSKKTDSIIALLEACPDLEVLYLTVNGLSAAGFWNRLFSRTMDIGARLNVLRLCDSRHRARRVDDPDALMHDMTEEVDAKLFIEWMDKHPRLVYAATEILPFVCLTAHSEQLDALARVAQRVGTAVDYSVFSEPYTMHDSTLDKGKIRLILTDTKDEKSLDVSVSATQKRLAEFVNEFHSTGTVPRLPCRVSFRTEDVDDDNEQPAGTQPRFPFRSVAVSTRRFTLGDAFFGNLRLDCHLVVGRRLIDAADLLQLDEYSTWRLTSASMERVLRNAVTDDVSMQLTFGSYSLDASAFAVLENGKSLRMHLYGYCRSDVAWSEAMVVDMLDTVERAYTQRPNASFSFSFGETYGKLATQETKLVVDGKERKTSNKWCADGRHCVRRRQMKAECTYGPGPSYPRVHIELDILARYDYEQMRAENARIRGSLRRHIAKRRAVTTGVAAGEETKDARVLAEGCILPTDLPAAKILGLITVDGDDVGDEMDGDCHCKQSWNPFTDPLPEIAPEH